MNLTLWIVQGLLAFVFIAVGFIPWLRLTQTLSSHNRSKSKQAALQTNGPEARFMWSITSENPIQRGLL
jgi:hypothetical protein